MNDGNDKTAVADTESVAQDRRNFLKKAAKVATVAPAVTLILSAASRSANATGGSGCWVDCGSGS